MRASVRLVRRYARALFEAAREDGVVADVGRDLRLTSELLSDPFVSAFLLDPSTDRAAKRREFVERLAPHTTPLFLRFANLVLERRREEVLASVAAAYALEADRAAGIVRGVAESARPLPEEEMRALEEALGRAAGATVKLVHRLVPELVGGIRIDLGGRRLDATVPGRFASLRERLLAAPLSQG